MSLSLSTLLSSLPSLQPHTTKYHRTPPFIHLRPPPPLTSLTIPTRTPDDGYPPISTTTNLPLSRDKMPKEEDGVGSVVLRSCFPSVAWANALWFKAGYYNVQVVVGEDEPEEVLLRRFKREVMKAGVIQECRRRKFFEDKQAKKKRRAREAARKNRRRPFDFKPKATLPEKEEKSKKVTEEEPDNWELPEGELPY